MLLGSKGLEIHESGPLVNSFSAIHRAIKCRCLMRLDNFQSESADDAVFSLPHDVIAAFCCPSKSGNQMISLLGQEETPPCRPLSQKNKTCQAFCKRAASSYQAVNSDGRYMILPPGSLTNSPLKCFRDRLEKPSFFRDELN